MTDDSQEVLQAIHTASNACARYQREPSGSDVWQTPFELAKSGVGDCEDFAIDALFRIRAAGLPGTVRLACCARGSDIHMVCVYRPIGVVYHYVLDVAADAVSKMYQRSDLVVLYELGLDGIYVMGRRVGPAEQCAPWANVLRRTGVGHD